jgi:hypothetical protein
MARWAWIAIAALGCSSRTGLAIDVDLGGAASAELIAPVRPCSDCDQGITPRGAAQPLLGHGGSGDVTYLDSTTRVLATADAHGHAHFELQASTTDPIAKLVIVGFDASDNATGTYAELTDVNVPRDHGVVWGVKLAPPAPDGKKLIAWRQPDAPCGSSPTHASCVGLQDTQDGSTSFYVPDDDPDCDGCTGSADCNRYWYLDEEDGVTCFTERSVGAGSQMACEGGLGTCIDGDGPAQMICSPISDTVCVPEAVCGAGTCFQGLSGCLEPMPVPPSYEVLSCTLLVNVIDTGGSTLDATPCPGAMGTTSVPLPVTACLGAGFPNPAPITSLTMLGAQPATPFTSPLLDPSGTTAQMTVVPDTSAGCALDFEWSGTLRFDNTVAPMLDDLYVIVSLGTTTQLILPMRVMIDPDVCIPGVASLQCGLSGPNTAFGCGL